MTPVKYERDIQLLICILRLLKNFENKETEEIGLVTPTAGAKAVFALRFQNLPARNSSLKIFKHEKEEKLAGPKGKLAGPAQFLVASGRRLMRRLLK